MRKQAPHNGAVKLRRNLFGVEMRKQVPHNGAVKLRRNLVGVEMAKLDLVNLIGNRGLRQRPVNLIGDARLRQRLVPSGDSDGWPRRVQIKSESYSSSSGVQTTEACLRWKSDDDVTNKQIFFSSTPTYVLKFPSFTYRFLSWRSNPTLTFIFSLSYAPTSSYLLSLHTILNSLCIVNVVTQKGLFEFLLRHLAPLSINK
jgi:hypothetical protein